MTKNSAPISWKPYGREGVVKSVLVVGAGTSELGIQLASEIPALVVTHLDTSETSVNWMNGWAERRRRCHQEGRGGAESPAAGIEENDSRILESSERRCEWVQGDALRMEPGWTERFDMVMDKGLLMALMGGGGKFFDGLLNEALRVLRPGGAFCIVTTSQVPLLRSKALTKRWAGSPSKAGEFELHPKPAAAAPGKGKAASTPQEAGAGGLTFGSAYLYVLLRPLPAEQESTGRAAALVSGEVVVGATTTTASMMTSGIGSSIMTTSVSGTEKQGRGATATGGYPLSTTTDS